MPDLVKAGLIRVPGSASVRTQRLIQPINKMLVGSGFKSPKYKARGVVKTSKGEHMEHFGADYWQAPDASKVLYGMGIGVVLRSGWDTTFGGTVVVRYNGCVNHRTGEVADVIVRCYHMQQIHVKAGTRVTKNTRLGVIGSTGRFCYGVHTHLEIDTDVEHPFAVPGINPTNLLGWKTVKSETIQDPAAWIHTKTSLPDRQTVASAGEYYRDVERLGDCVFPRIL